MSNNINIADMDNDFLITKASNNKIYPTPVYQTFNFYLLNFLGLLLTILIAVFSPIGLLFVISLLFQIYVSKKRWLYILGSVYQFVAAATTLIVGLAIIVGITDTSFTNTNVFLQDYIIGLAVGLLLVIATEIFFIVKMLKKYKKIYHNNQTSQQ